MNQSYPTSFKTLEKIRFLTTLWLFPSIFLKGRVSSGFILISTRLVCDTTDWQLGPQRGFAPQPCSSPAELVSCFQQRSLSGKKKFSAELQKDKLNKIISSHWTGHISDHVYWSHKSPNRKKMEITYHQPHNTFSFLSCRAILNDLSFIQEPKLLRFEHSKYFLKWGVGKPHISLFDFY